jgi:molecular chaperone GrpE
MLNDMKAQMEKTDRNQADAGPGGGADAMTEPDQEADVKVAGQPKEAVLNREEAAALKADAEKARHYYDQWLRTTADLDNYKKRATRERQDAIRFANEGIIEKLIPVLDNLDSALAAATTANTPALQSLQTGISMVCQQLKTVLTDAGLEEIDASNQPFDPNWHEALSQQPSADVPEGQVIQQLRKGYKLRDRLLRPAGVVVAKKPVG